MLRPQSTLFAVRVAARLAALLIACVFASTAAAQVHDPDDDLPPVFDDPLGLGEVDTTLERVHPRLPEEKPPVVGVIILITPLVEDTRLVVTMRDVGLETGLAPGAVGALIGREEAKVEVFECQAHRCFGYYEGRPEDLDGYRRVRFVFADEEGDD